MPASSTRLAFAALAIVAAGVARAGIFDDDEARKRIEEARAVQEKTARETAERIGRLEKLHKRRVDEHSHFANACSQRGDDFFGRASIDEASAARKEVEPYRVGPGIRRGERIGSRFHTANFYLEHRIAFFAPRQLSRAGIAIAPKIRRVRQLHPPQIPVTTK